MSTGTPRRSEFGVRHRFPFHLPRPSFARELSNIRHKCAAKGGKSVRRRASDHDMQTLYFPSQLLYHCQYGYSLQLHVVDTFDQWHATTGGEDSEAKMLDAVQHKDGRCLSGLD